MRPVRLAALTLAALLAGCGHPLLGAELEVPEVRMTSEEESFAAVPVGLPPLADRACPGVAGCMFAAFDYDLGEEIPFLDEEGVGVDLRLTEVALDLVSTSAPGLGALEAVEIQLRHPGTGDFVPVASWTSPGGPVDAIRVGGHTDLDLEPYLQDGKIAARIEIHYVPGEAVGAFTAELAAGFSVVVTIDYLDL
jgi:hypothetical protein